MDLQRYAPLRRGGKRCAFAASACAAGMVEFKQQAWSRVDRRRMTLSFSCTTSSDWHRAKSSGRSWPSPLLKGPDGETLMNNRSHALAGAVAVTMGSILLSAQTRDFQPVTDAMLQRPGPGEWLHWRGTQDAWAHSPT